MEDFHLKYAQSLNSYELYELNQTLSTLRSNLRDELNIIMYLKNCIINDKELVKYLDLFNRIESLILNSVERLTEFLLLIEGGMVSQVDEKVYNRYEYIKESYNEIFLNIQKVFESSSSLLNIRAKYLNERRNLDDVINKKNNAQELENIISGKDAGLPGNSELLNKIYSEVEELSRQQNTLYTEQNARKQNSYQVDKEMEGLKKNNKKKIAPPKGKPEINYPKIRNKTASVNKITSIQTSQTTRPQTTASGEEKLNKISKESLTRLGIESEAIRELCKEVERSINENCIMEGERKNLEKLKTEIIRISSEVNNITDDLKDFKKELFALMKRLDYLETENKSLKAHNSNLVSFTQNLSNNVNSRNDRLEIVNHSSVTNQKPLPEKKPHYSRQVQRVLLEKK